LPDLTYTHGDYGFGVQFSIYTPEGNPFNLSNISTAILNMTLSGSSTTNAIVLSIISASVGLVQWSVASTDLSSPGLYSCTIQLIGLNYNEHSVPFTILVV
jgi:hypothetical protein